MFDITINGSNEFVSTEKIQLTGAHSCVVNTNTGIPDTYKIYFSDKIGKCIHEGQLRDSKNFKLSKNIFSGNEHLGSPRGIMLLHEHLYVCDYEKKINTSTEFKFRIYFLF